MIERATLKPFLLLLLAAFLIAACVPSKYQMKITLQEHGKSGRLQFSDDFMDLSFHFGKSKISFDIFNKTGEDLTLFWDEMNIIMPDGQEMKVINENLFTGNKHVPQGHTLIPPASNYQGDLIPADLISPPDTLGLTRQDPLFDEKAIMTLKGRTLTLYMPVKRADFKRGYTLTFLIEDVTEVLDMDKSIRMMFIDQPHIY
jgi:hypothetical protein